VDDAVAEGQIAKYPARGRRFEFGIHEGLLDALRHPKMSGVGLPID
jgi:hypothetical protein